MFKKLFKCLTTLTLLIGCYFGYVYSFAIVVEQLKANKRTDYFVFPIHNSKSKQESIRYAVETCGKDHWAASEDLAYRYYNAERRYWIYAKECVRIDEENGVRYDGKRMRLTPFLLISKSTDGKDTKTITSDVATFDLNEPLSFNTSSSNEPIKIKHARLEPNVVIRDDKGTPRDPKDDMYTDPITTLEYEEATQQITTPLDTYVVMHDPDTSATGYGMLMQLRKIDPTTPGGSSGFEGVEKLDLLKNVHVVLRDVGESGIMPGAAPPKKAAPAKGVARIDVVGESDPKTAQALAAKPVEPTPLDLRCDSKMQVFLPKPPLPVLVGPPAPPAPTLVQFDRNVVVLRGKPDERPDQLTCDTLKLSMVPAEKPDEKETPAPEPGTEPRPAQPAEGLAQAGADAKEDAETKTDGNPEAKAADGQKSGPLGGLTLQRVHATGHAVWLFLPSSGVKLVCNELIHVRQLPFKPDQTYFRGDRTRPLQMEKIDVIEEDGPDKGKITGVTNIWTADATLFDSGVGMNAANVVAHGPGRLETRPDRGQPVERIAIWQDRLIVHNQLGADNQLAHKVIELYGNRPCFIDNLQKASLDSASWIQVWLKPKPAAPKPADAGSSSAALAGNTGTGNKDGAPLTVADANQTTPSSPNSDQSAAAQGGSTAGSGGGGLQMEQLHARVDVHLLAPAKTMTARELLDAFFVDAEPVAVASATPAKPADNPSAGTDPAAPGTDETKAPETEQTAANGEAEKPSDDPPMVGSCDRMWARLALKPKPEPDKTSSKETAKSTKTAKTAGTDAEIRKLWMWGNVALHQDPEKEKDKDKAANASGERKGKDAAGEALYLDNRGANKAITYVYQRDPTEKRFLPGPIPPARVEDAENQITAAGIIQMNQGTDQAWVYGPGTLTQLAARGFLTEKSKDEPTDEEPAGEPTDGDTAPLPGSRDSQVKVRTTALMVPKDDPDEPAAPQAKTADSKPKTRAGRPTSEKVPMTIGFSENMEFTGRTVDPEGHPAAQAEFYGIVTAKMEDGLLHCTRKMIAYTDREVPLAQLGKMSQSKPQKGDGEATTEDGEEKTQAELALIYCYRNAVAISRKVDPDAPILVQQQRIEADDMLAYDRRTGDFHVPGRGKVYLYDQSDKPAQKSESKSEGEGESNDDGTGAGAGTPTLTAAQRTVSTTSSRTPTRTSRDAGASEPATKKAKKRKGTLANHESKEEEDLPLVLIQVHFNKEMRGRMGSSAEKTNKPDQSWSEFFGDVEAARAKVANAKTRLDFDHLPTDGLFLTGQTLRVIQEPPPVGAPQKAASQYFMKAWEKAYAWNNDKFLQSDVITYDSYKDLLYAYGQDGHSVNFAEQHAAGQPTSPGSAKAVQLNPKTGGLRIIDSNTIQMIDKNTGYRPSAAAGFDPYAKKKKPNKKPFKLPPMNIERRGFTGQ